MNALIVLAVIASAAPVVRTGVKAGVGGVPVLGHSQIVVNNNPLGAVQGPAGQPVFTSPLPILNATVMQLNELGANPSEGGGGTHNTGSKIEKAMTGEAQISEEEKAFIAEVQSSVAVFDRIRESVGTVIVGQVEMINAVLETLISGDHSLLEGVPGVAKTQTILAVADSIAAEFKTIQGTPDLKPSDILGSEVLETRPDGTKEFVVKKGPVFANIVLLDEANRMMPKTQSAFLQAMQNRRVTIGNVTYNLPKEFFVLATQNPIEQEGTYRLPEAQLDRFMRKTIVPNPNENELIEIMERFSTANKPQAKKVATLDDIAAARSVSEKIRVSPELKRYIAQIVKATHEPVGGKNIVENGASPRAAIFLLKAARIRALIKGRTYVLPEDIREVAPDILRHRVALNYAAGETTVEQVIESVLGRVPVPTQQQ
jgi:MoxR-like ATPase